MWRAFFFAVGATLIILGAQGLIVDHIVIANGTRVPGFIAKFLDRGGRSPAVQRVGTVAVGNSVANQNLAQQVAFNAQRSNLSNQTGSRFGPSRLGDSQFSNTDLPPSLSYYGGVPFSNRQSSNRVNSQVPNSQVPYTGGPTGSNSQFSLAGFDSGQGLGNPVAQARQGSRLGPVTLGQGGSRLIKPAEWMPWGLLAVGTLVVLYTKSTGRVFASE